MITMRDDGAITLRSPRNYHTMPGPSVLRRRLVGLSTRCTDDHRRRSEHDAARGRTDPAFPRRGGED